MKFSFDFKKAMMLLLVSSPAFAQISGTVLDSKTSQPLSSASVFLDKTDIGTYTNDEGVFELKNVPQGTHDLIVSFVGYEAFKAQIKVVSGSRLNVGVIMLAPSALELNAIEVKATRDKKWEEQLRKFEKVFIGENKSSSLCKIVNPWVLDFSTDSINHKFKAKASAPLEISNYYLGYRVFFYLEEFWSLKSTYKIKGYTRFEELPALGVDQAVQWSRNREIAYTESYAHFFNALIHHKIKNNRYKIFYKGFIGGSKESNTPSVWLMMDTTKIISIKTHLGEFAVLLNGVVRVERMDHRKLSVSEMKIVGNGVIVNQCGFASNGEDIIVSGAYSKNRVSTWLPYSYQPDKIKSEQVRSEVRLLPANANEKIYVHLDKPYYRPKDTVWFKGYVKYNLIEQDSVSRVAYMDFIDPNNRILLTKMIRIENGVFYNDFTLSDTLAKGTYWIRAYTNFNRNFGDDNLFLKPIPILNMDDKIDSSHKKREDGSDSSLTVSPDKKKYKPREKITLSLKLKAGDLENSNLSVAVTDAVFVVPVNYPPGIKQTFASEENGKSCDFKYPIERGISFSARVLNAKGNPEKIALNIMQMGSSLSFAETDANGVFSLRGLDFHDSVTFLIKPESKKQFEGQVKLIQREAPPLKFTRPVFSDSLKVESSSGNAGQLQPKLLKEVIVKGRRIDDRYAKLRTRGTVILGKDLHQKGSLLANLMSIGPRYMVNMIDGERVLTRKVFVGGLGVGQVKWIPVAGSVNGSASSLEGINPDDVEFVFISGMSVSVFLKDGAERKARNSGVKILNVPGFSSPHRFHSPDYSTSKDTTHVDHRSTIYWNPIVTTNENGEATISFFAADLPAVYQIIVEGLSGAGQPIRSSTFIEIDDN